MARVLTHDGVDYHVLMVHGEDYHEEHAVATLTLTPEAVAALMQRVEAFQALAAQFPDLHSFRFWDARCTFRPAETDDDGWTETPPVPVWNDDMAGRTEIDCCEISPDGVRWTAYVKHTDMRISTEEIPLDDLRALLK
jgi:hypothetical protein